jgi:proteasome lid subunit RPN8/RPN11
MKASSERFFDLMLSKSAALSIGEAIADADNREICGFLLGYRRDKRIHVDGIRLTENIYRDRNSFAISQKEYDAALKTASAGAWVVGIYHSHYGSADMSCADRKNIKLHPFVWLIVGIAGQPGDYIYNWKCFKQNNDRIEEVRVSMMD